MSDTKPDIKADIKPALEDGGDRVSLMEPLLINESSRHRTAHSACRRLTPRRCHGRGVVPSFRMAR